MSNNEDEKINFIEYDRINKKISESICYNMNIYIFLEIYDFINKDDNYDYFKILFFIFINKINPLRDILYIYYKLKDANDSSDSNLIINLNKLIKDNVDFSEKIEEIKASIHDYENKQAIYTENYLDNNLINIDYIFFIILYEIKNKKKQLSTEDIIKKYYENTESDIYKKTYNIIDTYYITYNIICNDIYDKEKYLLLMITIIKSIFLTNYIDIQNTYAITCINIYLYEINELEKETINEMDKKNKKAHIILKLLARLLLVTNTFYLNNYTNYLLKNYNDISKSDKSINNFIDIFKNIISKVESSNFIEFKELFYKEEICDDNHNHNDKQIEYITIETIDTSNITIRLHNDLIMNGGTMENNEELKFNNPTYLLNYIPMNSCKRKKLITFITAELNKIEKLK